MRKRWMVMLVMLLCSCWFLPGKAQATSLPVLHRAEDGLTGEVSYYYYDEQGKVVRRIDQSGRCEIYNYYADGGLNCTLLYDQNTPCRLTRYDTHGNIQMIKDWYADGTIRYQHYTNSYDDQGRLQEVWYTDSLAVDQQAAWVCIYVYNDYDAGYMTEFHAFHSETDEEPYRSRFTYYDAEGRLLGDEDYYLNPESGNIVSNLYDENGNLTYTLQMRYDQDRQISMDTSYTCEYDTDGRLVKRERITSTTFTSSHDGTSETQAEVLVNKYQYDEAGRMIRDDYCYESGTDTAYETWTYDQYGNLLERNFTGRPLEVYEYAPLSEVLWKNQK